MAASWGGCEGFGEVPVGKGFQTKAQKGWGYGGPGLCGGQGRGQGCGAALGGGTDLSEVALLGVLQSEFMDAIEMIDICL